MKFRYLIFSIVCCLFVFNVSAISNVGVFDDLTIGDIGNFSSLDGQDVINNKGYSLIKNESFYYALPSMPNYTLGKFGGNLTQCGLSFVSENYYSVTYYFILNDLSNYVHPYYTSQKPQLGISSTVSNIFYNFDFSSVSSGIEILTLPEATIFGEYLGLFTVIFKAPEEGTCLNLAYSSSSKNASVNEVVFVGYKYNFLGSKPLTEVQIQNALSQNFVNLENKINNITNAQNQTNSKLDDIINSDLNDKDKELPDDKNYQDYQDTEKDLLDKANQADLGVLDIPIDVNSSNFVWDTMSKILNSHPLLFSTLLAILSIGVIKLALGR